MKKFFTITFIALVLLVNFGCANLFKKNILKDSRYYAKFEICDQETSLCVSGEGSPIEQAIKDTTLKLK